MQLLDVEPEIRFPAASRGAQIALENRLVAGVDEPVGLERVALGKPCHANVANVRLLAGMNSHVALELEGVRTRVGAVGTLVWPLPCMTSLNRIDSFSRLVV